MGCRGIQYNTAAVQLSLLTALFSSLALPQTQVVLSQQQAAQKIADKITRLTKDLDLKEARILEAMGESTQQTNRNDGTPFGSKTTDHVQWYAACTKWLGDRCEQYRDQGVSEHGYGPENSTVEKDVAQAAQKYGNAVENLGSGKVATGIYVLETNGGRVRDEENRLTFDNVTKASLRPDMAKRMDEIGTNTANQILARGLDSKSQNLNNTITNEEERQQAAFAFTRIMRDRFLGNWGAGVAAKRGIEYGTDEELNCGRYRQAVRNESDPRARAEQRIKEQGPLDNETMGRSLDDRYQLCMQAQNMSAYTVNPTIEGRSLKAGDKNREGILTWTNRMGLALMDDLSKSPQEVPHPENVNFTEKDAATSVVDYENGGKNARMVMMTPKKALEEYNNNIQEAAFKTKEISARTPFFKDTSDQVLAMQINPRGATAVGVNDLTPGQKDFLKGTNFKRVDPTVPDKALVLETRPAEVTVDKSELTITKLQ